MILIMLICSLLLSCSSNEVDFVENHNQLKQIWNEGLERKIKALCPDERLGLNVLAGHTWVCAGYPGRTRDSVFSLLLEEIEFGDKQFHKLVIIEECRGRPMKASVSYTIGFDESHLLYKYNFSYNALRDDLNNPQLNARRDSLSTVNASEWDDVLDGCQDSIRGVELRNTLNDGYMIIASCNWYILHYSVFEWNGEEFLFSDKIHASFYD